MSDTAGATVLDILEDTDVCICAGSGGVGKTTTSAAIAAGMAARGHKVAVLTIDPAKRLADSLGLSELGNERARVDPKLFERAGIEPGDGELWATMLDAKATFDEVVIRYSEDRESSEQILDNRIYKQISGALAGSQEYMAMEKLYEIHESGEFDLLVLDTPPSRNALDFLDAPQRLVQFVDGRALKMFLRPTGFGAKIAGRGAATILAVLRRLTGVDLIDDLSEFFNAMSGLVGGFKERATKVEALLGAEGTKFLIVTGPASEPISEAVYLHRKLVESELPFGGLVVNRLHVAADGAADDEEIATELAVALGEDLAERVMDSYRDRRGLVERDAANVEDLRDRIGAVPLLTIPEMADEIHDLVGLLSLQPHLFGAAAAAAPSQ
ncbi:MAG: AAA family ATPase [Solirubrobacterales bacterium]|nr:AAA family ATPase [Solirubrobacterales bacterium]